ncbi:hypothetical protein [Ectothiorhodospira sp. PHS-1]|uniref:hypothetical protein n=1 Tax=Ectothiorhodospira sp. PHS-1 TaxID=519989 RepID=UPI0002DBFC82|nr:hypothetical protein [Ectothiorhodospira sp. PHS-1]
MEHPVSIRQAFWSPYRRIARLIGEQLRKIAASRDKAVEDGTTAGITEATARAEAPKSMPAPFDIAKFAGIFAAIGLALGALGTAMAALISGLISLPPWKIPVVIAGVILLISGPSMILAWLKLRQRNLGPLLDANGWAVNTRAKINLPFGASLTGVAALPKGAHRSLDDPYAEKKLPWKTLLLLLVLVVTTVFLWREGLIRQGVDRLLKPGVQSEQSDEAAGAALESPEPPTTAPE